MSTGYNLDTAESILGPEGGLDELLLSVLKDLLAF